MRAGDIHWVVLPLDGGHEQQGRRPAIVLVISLITARAARRFAGTTSVHPTPENGLREESVALVFQLRAIDRRRLQERIGAVGVGALNAIFDELGKLLGRSS